MDRSSIAVIFEEGDSGLDSVQDVDPDKFLVEGVEVTGVIQPGAKRDCNDPAEKDDYPDDIDGACGFDNFPDVPHLPAAGRTARA